MWPCLLRTRSLCSLCGLSLQSAGISVQSRSPAQGNTYEHTVESTEWKLYWHQLRSIECKFSKKEKSAKQKKYCRTEKLLDCKTAVRGADPVRGGEGQIVLLGKQKLFRNRLQVLPLWSWEQVTWGRWAWGRSMSEALAAFRHTTQLTSSPVETDEK